MSIPGSESEPAPEEKPAEEKPAEEKPAESAPAEGTPAATPPEEKPAEKPAEEKPAESAAAPEPAAPTSETPKLSAVTEVAPLKAGDWSQWGGNSLRNNVPIVESVIDNWNPGKFDRKTGAHDPAKAKNIKWVIPLGTQTYGNPVVADGKVFVGTNNTYGYLKRYPGDGPLAVDLGCLLAIDEATGKFLWQHSSEKLPTGRVHDWPLMGICCSPMVEGDRLWFVTSRGEVRCLDVDGFYDGTDDGRPESAEPARLFDMMRAEKAEDKVTGYIPARCELPADVRKLRAAGVPCPRRSPSKPTTRPRPRKWTSKRVGDADRNFYFLLPGTRSAFITPDDKEEAECSGPGHDESFIATQHVQLLGHLPGGHPVRQFVQRRR
jgi:hypothetical protein